MKFEQFLPSCYLCFYGWNSRDTVQIPLCLRCSFLLQIFGITKIYSWSSCCLYWGLECSSFLPLCKKSYLLHTYSYENHNISHVIRMRMCFTLENGHILKWKYEIKIKFTQIKFCFKMEEKVYDIESKYIKKWLNLNIILIEEEVLSFLYFSYIFIQFNMVLC